MKTQLSACNVTQNLMINGMRRNYSKIQNSKKKNKTHAKGALLI